MLLMAFAQDPGAPVSIPAVQISLLPLYFPSFFILAGSIFWLLSLSFAQWFPTFPHLLRMGTLTGVDSQDLLQAWVPLWLKGSHKSTALHGVYLLWVHQRRVGKHKSTTCRTWLPKRHRSISPPPTLHLFSTVSAFVVGPAWPCQLGHFAGVHWKLWSPHTNFWQADLKRNLLQYG